MCSIDLTVFGVEVWRWSFADNLQRLDQILGSFRDVVLHEAARSVCRRDGDPNWFMGFAADGRVMTGIDINQKGGQRNADQALRDFLHAGLYHCARPHRL